MIKTRRALFVLLVGFCVLSASASASEPLEVTYYGLTSQPPLGETHDVQICLLDQDQVLEAQLGQTVQTWLKQGPLTHKQLASLTPRFHQLASVEQCQWQAKRLGVQALPAVVINKQWVIEGERNVSHAVSRYQALKHQRHLLAVHPNTGPHWTVTSLGENEVHL